MSASPPGERYVGLISGTSMDGIDAVVVDFSGPWPKLDAALTQAFEPALLAALHDVRSAPDAYPVADCGRLDARLGDALAEAALEAIDLAGCQPHQIRAIGSHGQTITHHAAEEPPFTLQIGDPWRLASRTGIATVADFRRADLAAGGQGAPLAPLLHDALFRHSSETRLVANLGGIANLTVLGPGQPTLGFDTGPANCLLDGWYRRHHAGAGYDRAGRWAASGCVDSDWLELLLRDPYLAAPAPKSTGIEYYSPQWLDERLPGWARARPADVQATLAEFSAVALARAISSAQPAASSRLLLCGGGVHNSHLVERIRQHLPGLPVASTAEHGLDPDYVEATLFAWLAQCHLAGKRIDTRSVTGAQRPIPAGSLFTR